MVLAVAEKMRGSSTHLPTLTGEASTWKGSHVLSVTQMDLGGLRLLFRVSQEMRTLVRSKGGDNRLAHRLLATVFYEASTRTSCSFQAAMQRLGGSHIHVDGGKGSNTSASKKGESLQDTVRCLECYTDLTVLRHPIKGTLAQVAAASEKPVINAGDGVGEHPTQALLDVFTIYDELKLKRLPSRRLTVVLLGDLKHGRTVHSLVLLLAASKGLIWTEELILRYCSPGALRMPHEIQKFVADTAPDVVQEMYSSLTEACEGDIPVNVLYVTRIQKERFESEKAYNEVKVRKDLGSYYYTKHRIQKKDYASLLSDY